MVTAAMLRRLYTTYSGRWLLVTGYWWLRRTEQPAVASNQQLATTCHRADSRKIRSSSDAGEPRPSRLLVAT